MILVVLRDDMEKKYGYQLYKTFDNERYEVHEREVEIVDTQGRLDSFKGEVVAEFDDDDKGAAHRHMTLLNGMRSILES